MGVTGLWRLIEPAGKPVPVETLENKVLAVDISIWLHQVVKGFQDAKGAPMPNAHLLGLFQRLCKLLYFRVKPVFVFDGGFPDLKKETIAKRQDNKAKMNSESERIRREILLLLGKKTAVGSLLGKQASPKKASKSDASADSEDLFKLPALEKSTEDSSSESESEDEATSAPAVDLHSIDVESDNFKSLPLREKHDLLIELKETRKMNSWGKLHELPKDSDNFADFQMNRLLKRRKVQECLEETEKEIGGNTMTLNELESLLNEEGIDTNIESLPTRRIASNNTTRYLLISNVKQALEDAKKVEMEKAKKTSSTSENVDDKNEDSNQGHTSTNKGHDELNDDLQKAIQMSLECDNDDDKSKEGTKGDESPDSTFMLDSDYSDTSEEDTVDFDFTSAKAFIMQNSDFTSNAIKDIITTNNAGIPTAKPKNRVDEIMKVLKLDAQTNSMDNKVVALSDEVEDEETVNLSSSDDECVEVKTSKEEIKDKRSEQETIVLDTTIEESDVSANDIIVDAANVEESLQDDSDSDEDFEEVPDNDSVEQTLKPVVELNLEMKDTIEDDIFADVFENKAQDMKDVDKIKLEEILKKDAHSFETVSPHINMNKPSSNTEPKLTHDTVLISETGTEVDKLTSVIPSEIIHDKVQTNITESITNVAQSAPKSSENEEKNERDDEVERESDKEKVPHEPITTEQLTSMAEQLQTEHEDLLQEKSRLDRMGRNITEQMTRDVQELLQIFGIPYVVAPSEAEAQCAFLESVKLTDGTITDDSDIWLFGGKTVYKNFFNQKKHVVQFLSERIDRSFNLSREQLILLALLVGSDYTTGVNGIGPVTAMEILASFSCSRKDILLFQAATNTHAKYTALLAGLLEFKKWVRTGKRTDDTSLRKKLRNVAVTDDFPSLRVVQAYMEPKVEKSEEKFSWGEPDLTVLREFTRKKFGWSQSKLDEMLGPVLKRMQERKSQRSVQDYFQRKVEFHSLEDQMSKRVKAAVEKMGPKSDNAPKTNMEPPKKIPKKRKPRGKANQSKSDIDTQLKPDGDGDVANLDGPSTSPVKSQIEIPNVVCAPDVTSSGFDIVVPKLDRYQEIIPQRELDRMNVLKNKMKAIETYRKSKLKQKGRKRRRVNLPKEKADLSESSDSD